MIGNGNGGRGLFLGTCAAEDCKPIRLLLGQERDAMQSSKRIDNRVVHVDAKLYSALDRASVTRPRERCN